MFTNQYHMENSVTGFCLQRVQDLRFIVKVLKVLLKRHCPAYRKGIYIQLERTSDAPWSVACYSEIPACISLVTLSLWPNRRNGLAGFNGAWLSGDDEWPLEPVTQTTTIVHLVSPDLRTKRWTVLNHSSCTVCPITEHSGSRQNGPSS